MGSWTKPAARSRRWRCATAQLLCSAWLISHTAVLAPSGFARTSPIALTQGGPAKALLEGVRLAPLWDTSHGFGNGLYERRHARMPRRSESWAEGRIPPQFNSPIRECGLKPARQRLLQSCHKWPAPCARGAICQGRPPLRAGRRPPDQSMRPSPVKLSTRPRRPGPHRECVGTGFGVGSLSPVALCSGTWMWVAARIYEPRIGRCRSL